jgi:hypothetical protein
VGLLVFAPILLSALVGPSGPGLDADAIRKHGPGFLLLYCLVNFFFSSGERGIYFSPAEIQFLFPGPFSRRQLLGYKVVMLFLMGLPAGLILTLVMRIHSPSFLSAFAGVVLMLLFMNLLSLTLNLLALSLDTRLYTRFRRLLALVLLVLGGAFLLFQGGAHWQEWHGGDLVAQVEENSIWQAATWPLRSFFEVFLAPRVWPNLVTWALPALAVNGLLLVLLFWMDANYLEAADANSRRIYARIQRLRGGNLFAGDGKGARVRFTLPSLPWWGGIGPIWWRQLLAGIRGLGRLTVVFMIFGVMLLAPLLANTGDKAGTQTILGLVAGMTIWLTIMLTALVPFDFRGDIDRMATLKTLPIPAWRLAVGQLLTPSLLLSCLQWLVLAFVLGVVLVDGWAGNDEVNRLWMFRFVLACFLFVFPFNFLLFGLENLLFLLFPARMLASTPGDFQAVGRNVLFMMGKMLGVALVCAVAGVGGVVVAVVSNNPVLGVAAAWVVLTCGAAALVPAVAVAFTQFDVGRDTPP